jgi:hypothetical protein
MKARLHAARAAAIGTLALLAACSGSSDTTTTTSSETAEARAALVTMRGVNAHALRSAMLTLSDVSVTADGNAVPVRIETPTLDLAEGDERVAARFQVPPGAENVDVTFNFDDYGGFEGKKQAGVIDARGTRVKLTLPARAIAESGKAQLSLDVDRSLHVGDAERRVFTPHFQLTY